LEKNQNVAATSSLAVKRFIDYRNTDESVYMTHTV